MANTELLNVTVLDEVVVLTLNRPQALNALNKQLITDLHGFFTQALESYNCSGVILTGSGAKAFAAGADIKEFVTMTPEEMQALSALGHELMFAMENSPVPIVAAIEGYALGGGFELALACHLRVGRSSQRGRLVPWKLIRMATDGVGCQTSGSLGRDYAGRDISRLGFTVRVVVRRLGLAAAKPWLADQ